MGHGSTTEYHNNDDIMIGEESTNKSVSSSTFLLRLHVEQQKYNATHPNNMLRNILSADSSLSDDHPNNDDTIYNESTKINTTATVSI